ALCLFGMEGGSLSAICPRLADFGPIRATTPRPKGLPVELGTSPHLTKMVILQSLQSFLILKQAVFRNDYPIASMRVIHAAFVASGRKLARMELAANWRNSSRVNPCSVWASRNSLARSEPKKAGSSELSVTSRP